MTKKINRIFALLVLSFMVALIPCGCGQDDPEAAEGIERSTKVAKGKIAKKGKGQANKEDYAKDGINELNSVPILMYHRIYDMKNSETGYTGGNVDVDGYNRTAEALEADFEYYYANDYRMIRLDDFVDGYIDVEYGKSPVIITFDDGVRDVVVEGFEDDGTPIFDPTCAIGILEKMKKKYPDYNVTATFFVNGGLFQNGDETDEKVMKWMVDNGYDIGNHTWNHADLGKCTPAQIEEEVGSVYQRLEEIIPGQYVNIVALPFGSPSASVVNAEYESIFNGSYEDMTYNTKAALLCAWTRAYSPFTSSFDPRCIYRIRGYDNNGKNFDIKQNFEELNNGKRYISDGDPDTIVIKEEEEDGWLAETYGREVIRY